MSRSRLLLILLIVLGIVSAFWIRHQNSGGPLVAFAKVGRETLVSTLSTDGMVQPSDWASVRAQRSGILARVLVQKGQDVKEGTLLAELDARDAKAEVDSAEAAVAQASAQLLTITQGGTGSAQVEIDNEIERNRMELKIAQRDYASLTRLAEKQAATQQDVVEAAERVQRLQASIQALTLKRAALVGPSDRAAAEARRKEAQASLEQARVRLEQSRIHSPIAGTVYDLPVRTGAYLNVGDLVADIGQLRTLRVQIYVDEPELGQVALGMPVEVTWDAVPGRTWKGTVEKLPVEVTVLGTRRVGEVLSTIANDDLKLLPGTHVNVAITSHVVENGLTVPKEAIRSEHGQVGVYFLQDGRVEWRPIRLGAASITRAVVTSGLSDGDMVALRTERPLHNGEQVRIAAAE
jgi:HlyD family secretion protein